MNDQNITIHEAARDIPVSEVADVVVCGAGPAGVAAAVASARKGARTVLIEQQGCLGGIWTSGLLAWVIDHSNKSGCVAELIERLEQRNGRAFNSLGEPTNTFNVEVMKLVLEQWCVEAGVAILLHTRVASVMRDGSRLTHILAESKSGRHAVSGKVFIDATGDGDLGALAGCDYEMGHPENGLTQPMSMIALISGINASKIHDFFNDQDGQPWSPPKDRLRKAMEDGGHSPSYAKPSLFRVRDDLFILMANHEYGYKGINAREVTQATVHARKELHDLIDGLRSTGGIWKDIHIVATPEQIGVREGRRLSGLYKVTLDDLQAGRHFDDGICRATFCVDVHSLNPEKTKGIEAHSWKTKPYDIPLRALIAKDVDGLMFAGRCISGDFFAHASYRVTGNAATMGEAAGEAAAVAALRQCSPSEVKVPVH